ncbi:MAG: nuclear transport factor 2 family protein [Hyphomicrobium sp.]
MRGLGRNVLEAIHASWNAKDIDAVLSCLSDDVAVMIHVPSDVMRWGGETRGKAQAELKMRAALREFEFLDYHPVPISDVGDSCHAQVHYHFRHIETGHEIEGTLRHIWQADWDKIVRLEEFHDTERLHAFFELLATGGSKP